MIGLFDSGVGGLSIYSEIKKLMPYVPCIYFADQAHFPYGEKTEGELKKFSRCISSFLIEKGAELIVVACNSATVSAINYLRTVFSIPFVGVVPAVKPAASITKTGKIAVLLTTASSKGKTYKELIETWANGVCVISVRLPELVEMVENGTINELSSKKFLFDKLKNLKEIGIDTIVLGCTHFIFLKDMITSEFGSTFNILDPAEGVAKQTYRVYSLRADMEESRDRQLENDMFYTSGNSEHLKAFIKDWLNIDLEGVHSIDLECMKT